MGRLVDFPHPVHSYQVRVGHHFFVSVTYTIP